MGIEFPFSKIFHKESNTYQKDYLTMAPIQCQSWPRILIRSKIRRPRQSIPKTYGNGSNVNWGISRDGTRSLFRLFCKPFLVHRARNSLDNPLLVILTKALYISRVGTWSLLSGPRTPLFIAKGNLLKQSHKKILKPKPRILEGKA